MKVYDVVRSAYTERNKDEGKKITKDTIVPHLAAFFHDGRGVRAAALRGIKRKLAELRTALREEGAFRMYSTSLLLLYEGAEPESDEADVRCDVRMIDFAHVYPHIEGTESDDGYMWGLENLINLLEQI
jgi:inositol-hexakisphosphate kinase